MSAPRWWDDWPAAAGWYWFADAPVTVYDRPDAYTVLAEIVHLVPWMGGLGVLHAGRLGPDALAEYTGRWWGPIPPPPDEEG